MKHSTLEQMLTASKPDTPNRSVFTARTMEAIRFAQANETFDQVLRTTNTHKKEHPFMTLRKKLSAYKHPKLAYFSMFSVIALVLIAAVATAFTLQHRRTTAAPSVTPGLGASIPSQFTFSGAIGWWQGATNRTSIAVFHGGDTDSCFVSVQHNTGSISADEAKVTGNTNTLTNQGYAVTPFSTKSLTFQTTEGAKQYQLDR
jgi:hypothetical protein